MASFGLKMGQDLGNRAAHPYQEFRGVVLLNIACVQPPPPLGKNRGERDPFPSATKEIGNVCTQAMLNSFRICLSGN